MGRLQQADDLSPPFKQQHGVARGVDSVVTDLAFAAAKQETLSALEPVPRRRHGSPRAFLAADCARC
jgi:hypothetical protein